MEVVGEALLSAVVGLLFDKLASTDLLNFARQQWVYSDLKKWETELLDIREVLNDAEERQTTDLSVKAWLGNLRDLAYDMEDILDEFAYEALKWEHTAGVEEDEEEAEHQGRPSKVRKLISTCLAIFNPTEVMRYVNLRSKVWKITRRLRDISAQKSELGLEKAAAALTVSVLGRPVNTSLVYEPQVYGRDTDIQIIIDMLLRDDSAETNVSVVCIVTMGGMGKTTLARLVYDDDGDDKIIAKHFDLKAWVCVSDQFDAVSITKTILNLVRYHSVDSHDLCQIQEELKKELKGKKFLIVLDDLWNDDYSELDRLCSPFWVGAQGSRILVTTRNINVANKMRGHKNLHHLKQLSDDDCWLVFQTHAFQNVNIKKHPNLESIGRKIVEKCGGLPLAARALGGLLRSELRECEWERVLSSKIWDFKDKECEIIPALRLSYNNLPSHLKRCFAYCAIFPQDYEFTKEELILLWMAEGLIQQPKDDKQKNEDLGDKYFYELLSRSFFQSSINNRSQFVMHDLVNALAKYVAGDTCLHLDDEFKNNLQFQIPESTHHLSFVCQEYDVFKKFERFYKKNLRTFIAVSTQRWFGNQYISNKVLRELIPRLGCLRALSLSGYMIYEIPKEFGDLKLLRYLSLSHTQIKYLPDSMGDLYNLQALILSYCHNLSKLPTSIGNLIKLRHLDVTGAVQLKQMPSQIRKLKDLRILPKFIVGKGNGLNIRELKNMPNLEGELWISNLENVVNVQDAKLAGLKLKYNLERLIMSWSTELNDSWNEIDQMDVLNSLEPQSNVKKLSIHSYGGPEFPRWIRSGSFSKMVDLSLVDCKNCTSLPCLGQLQELKYLLIEGMDAIKEVGEEFYGETHLATDPFFPSLQSLRFSSMVEWEYWGDYSSPTESLFPCLHDLEIVNCPKLISKLPTHLPSLAKLFIWDCPKLEIPDLRVPVLEELKVWKCDEAILRSGTGLTSLTEITVYKILGLTKVKEGFLRSLPWLRALKIWECEELTCLWEDGFESESLQYYNLQSLEIIDCDNLERLPDRWQNLTCLEILDIKYCSKLVSFPEVGFPPKLRVLNLESCEGLKCLPAGMMRNGDDVRNSCVLESLEICNCSSLICFPKGQLPTTLKKLSFYDCENLNSLPEGMTDMGALEHLSMEACPSLIRFPEGGLPTTLKLLSISHCEKLESLPEGVMHHRSAIPNLQILEIYRCSSLACFPKGKFPSSLERLQIEDCARLESISEQMFYSSANISLQSLFIGSYPNLISLPNCIYNLSHLYLHYCKNLESLPHQMKNLTRLKWLEIINCEDIKIPLFQWGLTRLTSLKYLFLEGMFPNATSFSDVHHLSLLPATLTSLHIEKFQNLESLASLSLQTLPSLEQLWIYHCPELRTVLLREEHFPDTLLALRIRNCPFLKKRFSKEKGEDWPKVSHIPRVEIDDELIFE